MAAPPEIEQLLEQVRNELLRILDTNENGTLTIHCGPSQFLIETNSKKPPIKRIAPRQIPAKS